MSSTTTYSLFNDRLDSGEISPTDIINNNSNNVTEALVKLGITPETARYLTPSSFNGVLECSNEANDEVNNDITRDELDDICGSMSLAVSDGHELEMYLREKEEKEYNEDTIKKQISIGFLRRCNINVSTNASEVHAIAKKIIAMRFT